MRFVIVLLVVSALLMPVHRAAMQDNAVHFEERTLTFDGLVRRYLLYVPPSVDGLSPVPLVFLLHGGGGSPDIYEGVTGMGALASTQGFILVYPAGTGLGGSKVTACSPGIPATAAATRCAATWTTWGFSARWC